MKVQHSQCILPLSAVPMVSRSESAIPVLCVSAPAHGCHIATHVQSKTITEQENIYVSKICITVACEKKKKGLLFSELVMLDFHKEKGCHRS